MPRYPEDVLVEQWAPGVTRAAVIRDPSITPWHAMANGPLPELLRDLGVETLLDDPETLHRMAEVALDRAGLAANGRAPEEYRLEVELFEWCTKRLALLAAEDSVLHAAAPSTSRH